MNTLTHEYFQYPIALVAEDDDSVRSQIASFLRDEGYGVLEASTSVEALLLAVDFPDRIDALFTSTTLRKYCNGYELAECLRATRPEMAVFYLENAPESGDDVTRDLILGRATLLRKPVLVPRLEEAISLIEENRSWAQASADRMERIQG